MAPGTESGRRPVLIAYDGSEQAKVAIAEAGRILGPGRPAVVLTVREPIESYDFAGLGGATTLDPATVSAMQEAAQNEATVVAEEGAELARAAGFEAETRVEVGPSPWQEIVAVADQLDADVIAIGSRGRTGLKKVLLGSVASAVAQHSGRSVLIVRG
jgi:nucleotide-binding universal stress UspA family protein